VQERLGLRRALRARTAKFKRRGVDLAAGLALAFMAGPAAARPSLAVKPAPATGEQPALWVLSDADTTIYLFGTFHALDAHTDWFGRSIRAAFDQSDELVLETVVPTDPAELFGALSRHDLAAPPVAGGPIVGETEPSFAATARSAMSVGRSAGLSLDRGADAVLRRLADAEGKPVDGLESFDFQLGMVRTLPIAAAAPPAPALLPSGMARQPDIRSLLLAMRSAWKRGDGSSFAAVLGNLEVQSPATYQRLFVDRNRHWARWIAGRMGRPGTVFVAVGTGHLIGRDSLQQKLARHGYRATRIR
jgi:uncharacterized protein YbaP (TraB family)